eukprot:12256139-Ditylum_brightwellii.AAC.1
MARAKRRLDRKHFNKHKKSKVDDLSGHDDSMDVNHPDKCEIFTEELEKRDTDGMNQEDDGTDDEDENNEDNDG